MQATHLAAARRQVESVVPRFVISQQRVCAGSQQRVHHLRVTEEDGVV
jgi:hypothetical protein